MKEFCKRVFLFVCAAIFASMFFGELPASAIESGNLLSFWEKPENWDFFQNGEQYEHKILLVCDSSRLRKLINLGSLSLDTPCKDFAKIVAQAVTDESIVNDTLISLDAINVSSFKTENGFNLPNGFVCGKEVVEISYEESRNSNIELIISAIRKAILKVESIYNIKESLSAISGIGPLHGGTPSGFDWAIKAINTPLPIINASSSRVAVLDTGVNQKFILVSSPKNYIDPEVSTIDVDDDFVNHTDLSLINDPVTSGHGTLVASIISETGLTTKQVVVANNKTIPPSKIVFTTAWNSGVTQNTQIIPIKVCRENGTCSLSSIVAGICSAVQPFPIGSPKPTGPLAQIINLSLGTYIQSPILEGAIRDAISAGTLVVAASGNSRKIDLKEPNLPTLNKFIADSEKKKLITDGFISKAGIVQPKAFCNPNALGRIWGAPKAWNTMNEDEKNKFFDSSTEFLRKQGRFNCPLYPAALSFGAKKADGLVSVGSVSVSSATNKFMYSEFATKNQKVDLVAPGDEVLALQSNGGPTTVLNFDQVLPGAFLLKNPAAGTSFSAAYVSGAVAAIIAQRTASGKKAFSPVELEKILLESIKSTNPFKCVPGPEDPADVCGAGLLDVKTALALAATK
jgi:subtilisin family serine protease